jgi:alpha-D-ribose 1-methylphosphonate 5-triphosphate synthase subunit PhnH
VTPAFADPVLGAQAAFRAILDAMSRPGRIQRVAAIAPPAPLAPAAAAAMLALADPATPACTGAGGGAMAATRWMRPGRLIASRMARKAAWTDAGEAARAWLAFHAGCPFVEAPGEAAFVLATGAPPPLAALHAGTDEEPERGATLILQVTALAEGGGWRLTGPGIAREHRLAVSGLAPDFATRWAEQRGLFPRGVDVILCAGDALAALPRTVLIGEA